jgi:hypothetical protein
MADFFRGLTGGFQTGLQFGNAMQQREERERLREAMGLTPQEMQQRQATPEELGRAQAETRGLAAQDAAEFGLSPQEQAAYAPQMPVEGQRIGAPQYGLGGQTFNRMPTQQEIESARYGAAANIIAERDPFAAFRMRQEQTRAEREAVEAPLRLKGLEQQVARGGQELQTGELTLAEKKSAAADRERMNNFNTAFGEANAAAEAEGRTLTARDIANLAKANKLSYSQENELIASQVNRTKAEVDQFRLDVEKTVQGKGFEQLVDLHKNDKRFGDGMHFVPEVDPKTGGVTMARVNEATGRVEERLKFKTKAEATAYLREEAANPANAAIWLQNYQKGAATIAELEAGTGLKRAQADYFAGGGAAAGKATDVKIRSMEKSLGRPLTEDEKLIQFGIQPKPSNRPEFTPQAYTTTIKNYVDIGMSVPAATAEADRLFGRGPAAGNIDATLQKANADKAKAAGAPAAKTVAPAVGPLYAADEDYMGLPVGLAPKQLNQGYGVVDARGLLRTPSYGAGASRFNPD